MSTVSDAMDQLGDELSKMGDDIARDVEEATQGLKGASVSLSCDGTVDVTVNNGHVVIVGNVKSLRVNDDMYDIKKKV